jgi:prevent-host-death family protein
MDTWQLQDAKNRFSELVENARSRGPQLVTRRGKPAVVVLSAEQYQEAFSENGSILDTLLAAPRMGDALELERDRTPAREVEL